MRVKPMNRKQEQLESNVATLVKLTRVSQCPSPAFVMWLTKAVRRELKSLRREPGRRGGNPMSNPKWNVAVTGAVAGLITVGIAVTVFRGQASLPVTHTTANTVCTETMNRQTPPLDQSPSPLPLRLPKAAFVGTKENIQGIPHLEKLQDTERSPFLAPADATNVALNKPVIGSVEEPILGELQMITDGDKEAADQSLVELDPFSQNVTVDLESEHEIFAILFWHYHKTARVYFDVVVQVSSDPDFVEDVTLLFNNDLDNSSGLGVGEDMHYIETHQGKLVDTKGIRGRYVRLHSMGSSASDVNHYLEIEVYGRPVPAE